MIAVAKWKNTRVRRTKIKPKPSTINARIAGINDKFKIMNKQSTKKNKSSSGEIKEKKFLAPTE